VSGLLDPGRTLEERRQAVANLFDFLVKGGIADTTRTPSEVIDEGRKRTLHRYEPSNGDTRGLPVLMVPPLGAQATCFDLRRGCSMTEHFVTAGRPSYLVDYGSISFSDKELGLEFWVNEVLPPAVRKVSEDAGGAPVNLVGWCMGGLLSLVTVAAYEELPINSVAMVASPFDMSQNPMLAPLRKVSEVTGGNVLGGVFRALGGIPSQIVGPGFKLTSLPTYVKKPITLFRHRDDREFLAHVEAVDQLMNNMYSYPGRATLQAYQKLAIKNELASGRVQGPNRLVDLADVQVPVMNIAGNNDVLVPVAVAHHVGALLPNAREVRLETAPGGHLGVLTGRSSAATTWAVIDDFLDAHATA
jgi:polyhydroxyalkanoate synthase